MGSLILPSVFRQQPQQGVRLDSSNRLAAAAQAVVLGSLPINVATGKPLTVAGTATKLATPAGIADSFRKNGYRETELLPAIGTQTFVEFWIGYPSSDLYSKGNGDVGFLTGSSNNSTGIASSLGTKEIVVGSYTGTDWGAVYNWGTLNTAGEALVAGKLTCLVVVRRQDRMEFWRNGVMVKSVTESPTNYGASKFIVGSFVEDLTYWTSSSDTLMAGRAIVDLSPAEVQAFSANPWQIFQAPARRLWLAASAPAGNAYALPAAQGSYAITGNPAGLRVARRLTATVGTYGLTGNAAALKVARRMAAALGAYSITGQPANLVKSATTHLLLATGGAYAITGQPAALRVARRLPAAPGSYVITGAATGAPVSGAIPRFADATIMRLSTLRGVVDLGPDRINQTASLL
jgi:hypothetical protein